MAREHEKNPSVLPNNEFEGLMCEHKDSNVNYFALGLCESCYKDEWGNLSDIDDEEVDGYLFNEKEMHYMNILWENWNQEYEEQAADEAVAAAKKEFYDAILNKCMEDVVEARGHYESAVTALAKFRKEKQRRAQQAKTKSLGNEVNFERLEKLFEHKPLADEEHY